jgi:hypothetical protein
LLYDVDGRVIPGLDPGTGHDGFVLGRSLSKASGITRGAVSSLRQTKVVIAGLDPAIAVAHSIFPGGSSDCQVKPGNDDIALFQRYYEAARRMPGYLAYLPR